MINRKEVRRKALKAHRRLRELWMIGKGLAFTGHPIMAHIIPVRRCNLSCTYCNEFDDLSKPVPLEEMFQRIDKLAALGTSVITISGGEPLLHPQLDDIIRRVRSHGSISGMITNGYLITADRIERLNRAGLEHLQISIDNVNPDEVSKKSLKVLDKKLQLLAEYADFQVNINSVVGSGIKHPEDAITVAKRAVELGFTSTLGVIHDGFGQFRPVGDRERDVFHTVKELGKRSYARFDKFQHDVIYGRPHEWQCRAGGRYLYICEDGLVHYCSQQRGYPAVPLEKYTRADVVREFNTQKTCAPHCTISCVQQISMIDGWRRRPQRAAQPVLQPREELVQIEE